MKVVESLLMFVFLVYFASCLDQSLATVEEEPQPTDRYANVDARLWPYFESFEAAAASAGISIDLNQHKIMGAIEQIDEDNVAGTCSYAHRRSDKEIVLDSEFWKSASPLYKEYIVFHELGHCVLGRNHLEACRTNGTWASLMRSGLGSCRDNYNLNTRQYYHEELFSPLLTP